MATAGTLNTGSGGGGGSWFNSGTPYSSAPNNYGASGGKGIVIIRYSDALGQRATGGTIITPSGYVVHTFTGDGTFATNADFGQTTTIDYSIN